MIEGRHTIEELYLFLKLDIWPTATSTQALVVSNADPQGLGRVTVEFPFANDMPCDTRLRVMSPDAGGLVGLGTKSGEVRKNRGLVFVPEKGDRVMVGFEFGDPNRPYVMGSMFHGKNAQGGGANNVIKSIMTKSGIKIVFNDGQKSLHIEDPSGNTWDMDGKGNIAVNAPENINISGKNIRLNAFHNMEINVGKQLTTNVVRQIITHVQNFKQVVKEFMHFDAGKMLISTSDNLKMESPEIYAIGQDKMFIHSEQSVVINSKGNAEIRGKQGSNFANIAEDYTFSNQIDAKAIVMFMPMDNWKGEFGFDWMRTGKGSAIGQTNMPNDKDYNTIMGYYPGNNTSNAFVPDADNNGNGVKDMYEELKKEYKPIFMTYKLDAANNPVEYFIPVLRLYRHPNDIAGTFSRANLRLQIEVMEEPDRLVLEYDSNCFRIIEAIVPLPVPSLSSIQINTSPAVSSVTPADTEANQDTSSTVEETTSPDNSTRTTTAPTLSGGTKRFTISKKMQSTAASPSTLDITIECIANFASAKEIKAVSIKKDENTGNDIETLAGIMRVMPNDRTHRKIKKIVFVNVITDINRDGTPEKGFDNFPVDVQKQIFRKNLRQALIDPVIEESKIDITLFTPAQITFFNTKYAHSATDIKCYDERTGSSFTQVDTYLRGKLPAAYRTSGHICVFYFNVPIFRIKSDGTSGNINGYNSGKNIVMGMYADKDTPAHEILHALKLEHIFEHKSQSTPSRQCPNAKHCFKQSETNNIMDYTNSTDVRHFMYGWQAEIANGAADPEPANYRPQ